MAFATFHYVFVGPTAQGIARYVPGSVTVIGSDPKLAIDVQIDTAFQTDLDELMHTLGFKPGSGTGLYWQKFTKTFADFSVAAFANDVQLFQLQPKQMIHSVVIKHSASFTGGLIAAYTISVGTGLVPVKYATAFDVFQAPGDSIDLPSNILGTESFSTGTDIFAHAISAGAFLNAATTGSVDIWVLVSTLP